uniref:Kinesin motor domain-containing protein n=1 Tax=Ascaris lumbricoides TaxID=6252 RepID=A0A0M3HH14_ASCLU
MASCFNMSMCLSRNHFRVYVYPDNNESTVSIVYANILKVLRESVYYTDDPSKACLFVLSIDTIDRDRKRFDEDLILQSLSSIFRNVLHRRKFT